MDSEINNLINKQFKALINPSQYSKSDEPPYESMHYWSYIPQYLIARCPICKQPHTQQVDNYSLWHWNANKSMKHVNYDEHPQYCEHFIGVQSFLNFNGQLPTQTELRDKRLRSAEPEVPFINPYLLPDHLESYAVIHALPVGKIEGDNFSLPYTVYSISYYGNPWEEVFAHCLFQWTKPYKIKQRFNNYRRALRWGLHWEEASQMPLAWDLMYWVNKGKLHWLDLEKLNDGIPQLELPLNNPTSSFPYLNISGVKHAYIYTPPNYEKLKTSDDKENIQSHLPVLFFRIGRQIIDSLDITKLNHGELQDYYRLVEEQKNSEI